MMSNAFSGSEPNSSEVLDVLLGQTRPNPLPIDLVEIVRQMSGERRRELFQLFLEAEADRLIILPSLQLREHIARESSGLLSSCLN